VSEAPTIAVLPFEELGGDPEAGWFARGVTEDVITELSRFAPLEVIHAHSSFASGAAAKDDRELGAELGARHLLRGSVRRAGERIVVSTRLSEAASGRQLAAHRFEAAARDLPALELDVASHVAGALAIRLDEHRLAGARRKPVAELAAYECWLRGLDHLRHGTPADDARARELFERALAIDPCFARAHAGLSLSHFNEWSCQAWHRWDETERAAFETARRAVALDESDHVTQLILGRVHLYRREYDAARRRLELALELNPNDADALVQIALGLSTLGEPARALVLIGKAKRLNPKHGDWYFGFELYPRFLAGEYAEVLRLGALAGAFAVDMGAFLAAAAAHLGRMDEARARLAEFLADFRAKILFGAEPEPGEPLRWVLHVNPFARAEDEARLVRGLALAGLAPDPDAAVTARSERSADAEFARDGDGWRIAYGGASVHLGDLKGFQDLAYLLARPGEEVHCLELAGRPAEGADEVCDREGLATLRRRARELEEELAEARAHADLGRIEALAAELDALGESLAAALGLGGRARTLGSAAEKARTAVTWRIRSAIRKVAAAHPALGRHLANSVRTGSFCAYAPETPVAWRL
jgi:TolB-like protein